MAVSDEMKLKLLKGKNNISSREDAQLLYDKDKFIVPEKPSADAVWSVEYGAWTGNAGAMVGDVADSHTSSVADDEAATEDDGSVFDIGGYVSDLFGGDDEESDDDEDDDYGTEYANFKGKRDGDETDDTGVTIGTRTTSNSESDDDDDEDDEGGWGESDFQDEDGGYDLTADNYESLDGYDYLENLGDEFDDFNDELEGYTLEELFDFNNAGFREAEVESFGGEGTDYWGNKHEGGYDGMGSDAYGVNTTDEFEDYDKGYDIGAQFAARMQDGAYSDVTSSMIRSIVKAVGDGFKHAGVLGGLLAGGATAIKSYDNFDDRMNDTLKEYGVDPSAIDEMANRGGKHTPGLSYGSFDGDEMSGSGGSDGDGGGRNEPSQSSAATTPTDTATETGTTSQKTTTIPYQSNNYARNATRGNGTAAALAYANSRTGGASNDFLDMLREYGIIGG